MRYFGKVKWFGGYDSKKETSNNYGFIEDENGNNLYIHRDDIRSSVSYDRDLKDKIVTFDISLNNKNKNATNLTFIREEKDIEVFRRIFLMDNDLYLYSIFSLVGELFNDGEVLKLIDSRLEKYGTNDFFESKIPQKLVPLILQPSMLNIRQKLSVKYRFKIYSSHNNILSLSDEIIQLHHQITSNEWESFCQTIKNQISYESQLYKLAPDTVKASICRLYFKEWLNLIEDCSNPPISYKTQWPCKEIYNNLTEDDKKLAMLWMQSVSLNAKDAENMKMISARGAEKATEKFYQALGLHVDDVAITQISNHQQRINTDWKLCDLRLDKKYLVDVKNARTSINNKNRYVEHCIPRFKENRENQQVIIAGVLSSYVKFLDFNNQSYYDDNTIRFLGETCLSTIIKLEKVFNKKPNYFSLSLSTRDGSSNSFIPVWLFEYPPAFYQQRQQFRDKLKLVSLDIPTREEIQLMNVNPIPAYLASRILLPKDMEKQLKTWQIIFYNLVLKRTQTEKNISMPFIFLALLRHFLWMVRQSSAKGIEDYSPSGYYELLYPLSQMEVSKKIMPLGIYDPLCIIDHWIDTLETLWRNRTKLQLERFQCFKFTGAGLLKGRSSNTAQWVTILAHCGGFIEAKGKCGYSPLVVGEHQTCSSCGYLICPSCGCCNQKTKWVTGCLDCAERMAKIAKNMIRDIK